MDTPTEAPGRPLIVTALFDEASQALFESLRRQHFPTDRNFIPAHLTLFHHLPGPELEAVRTTLARLAAGMQPPPFRTRGTRFLGRGVALVIDCPQLETIRGVLASAFAPHLTAQDRQPFRPHVTVQNKVDPALARATETSLAGLSRSGHVTALGLWFYVGGPWEKVTEFPFGAR